MSPLGRDSPFRGTGHDGRHDEIWRDCDERCVKHAAREPIPDQRDAQGVRHVP